MALKTGKAARKTGFTLIELLPVIAIGAIIATLSISSYTKMVNSGLLTTSTQAVIGLLEQARQTAISRNVYVEVRFYQLPPASASTTSPVYRAMQSFIVTSTGYVPLSKILFLPTPVAIQTNNTTHTTLLDPSMDSTNIVVRSAANWGTVTPPMTSAPAIPNYGINYSAIPFRFTPKGSLADLDPTKQWFFTFFSTSDKIVGSALPANYVTIQVDGFTGRAIYYRP